MPIPMETLKGAAKDIVSSGQQQDAGLSKNLASMQEANLARQREGMRQTAGEQNWEQAWKDVRKARQSSPDSYRTSRQKRFSQKYPQ